MDVEIKQTIFKDIYKLIYEIKKCKSKSRYNALYLDLYTLYDMCKILKITDYPKLENYSNKSFEDDVFKLINNFSDQVEKDFDYHLEFTNNVNNINENKYDGFYITQNIIFIEETLYLVYDFLNSYDKKLLKTFDDLRNSNKVLKTNNDTKLNNELKVPAQTIASLGIFKPYLIIEEQNSITDSINIIHELGHCYDSINNKTISNKIFNQKRINCLEEVYSFYLQFIYIEYLKNKKIYLEDIEKAISGYNYTYVYMIKELNKSLNGFKEQNFDVISDELNYSYGIATAYHFLDRYLIDPEKTKIEIEKFVLLNGQYNMMETLEKFNLKDELLDTKILKKYI